MFPPSHSVFHLYLDILDTTLVDDFNWKTLQKDFDMQFAL